MKKIVLLSINAKYVHSSLSVWLLAAGIKQFAKRQYNVSVIESTINQKVADIVESIKEHHPDILGVSTYIWNAGMLPKLIEKLRKFFPELIIVFGGPEASFNAEFWLSNGADYVVCGEGEYAFAKLLDEFSDSELSVYTHIPTSNNIYHRIRRGALCAHSGERSSPLQLANHFAFAYSGNTLPHIVTDPYSQEYFSSLSNRLSYIETSRGCPFSCAFCLSGDSALRFFPLDIVKEQIYKLSQSGTHTIKFVDRTFNCNPERSYEILKYVIELNSPCRFHFEVAADLFDERTLELLSTAPHGKIQLEIGLQSFFQPALNASSRKTDLAGAVKNILTLLEYKNIHIHVDLIAGLPYETLDEFKKSFNKAYSLNAHTLQLGFLKLLHGSELRKNAESLGIEYSNAPPYEIISSKWLSLDDLRELKTVENALQHTYNKGRFLRTIDYVLAVSTLDSYDLMFSLGSAFPNFGTQLEKYVVQIFEHFSSLPNINADILSDLMICDWLEMVKGKNAPQFLKNDNSRRPDVLAVAEEHLGRNVRREEYAVLRSGKGVFVDSNDKNPVTGLYRIYVVEI